MRLALHSPNAVAEDGVAGVVTSAASVAESAEKNVVSVVAVAACKHIAINKQSRVRSNSSPYAL
jgi:hypothetical protein